MTTTPGLTHPQECPPGFLPARLDASVIDVRAALASFVGDPVYLVDATPFDADLVAQHLALPAPAAWLPPAYSPFVTVTGAETTVQVATRNYRTLATDAPAYTLYPGLLDEPGYSFSALTGSTSDPLGSADTSFGVLSVIEAPDDWLDYSWGGRELSVKAVQAGAAVSSAVQVFRSTVGDGVSFNEQVLTLPLVSFLQTLATPLIMSLYTGAGALAGPPALTGNVVPKVLGLCRRVGMNLLDEGNQIWQVCDSASSFTNVANQALAVTASGTDWATYAALAAASSPAAGYYDTCLACGCIRFGSVVSVPQADVYGPAAAGTSATDIVQYVVQYLCSAAWTGANLDTASFAALKSLRGYTVGRYVDSNITVLALVQQLLHDIGAFGQCTRDGLLQVLPYRADTSPVNTIPESLVAEDGISVSGSMPPLRRLLIQYQPSVKVLGDGEVSAAATQDQRLAYTQDYLSLDPIDALSIHRTAQDITFQTSIDSESDADALGSDLEAFLKLRRELSIPLAARTFQYWPGGFYTFTYPRAGFAAGRPVFLAGVQEQADGNNALIVRYDPDG